MQAGVACMLAVRRYSGASITATASCSHSHDIANNTVPAQPMQISQNGHAQLVEYYEQDMYNTSAGQTS